ncbi:MAG: zinc ribbon domain-containing protein [Lentisphaerae bacterium]|nr:zinc ribbon domain-containing protein [Lentisphaerota bacterium]
MPIFEYRCQTCGHAFEHLARSRTDLPGACAKCGAPAIVKQLSTFAARADASAARACDSCPATPSCPTARRGCCGGACSHSHA